MNAVTIAVLCGFLAIIITSVSRRQSNANLPPGPKGNWIFGNLGDLISQYQWKRFAAWSKTYGDVIYLTVLGRPVIVLNKFEHARELMEKRGATYSDRPCMPYITDLCFLPFSDEKWRSHRRLLQQYLNPRAVAQFRPIQTKCVRSLLNDLLTDPDDFWKHVRQFAASAVLSATYGYTPARKEDPLIMLNNHSESAIIKPGPPGATMVDLFPMLRFIPTILPWTSFKKAALEARDALDEMSARPFKMVKEQRASGTAVPSLLTHMLDDLERQGVDDEIRFEVVKDVCGSTYRGEATNRFVVVLTNSVLSSAGVATTMATLYTFILAMVLNPEVAKKAQEELDSVSDGERLPTFDDQESLPYITCIMKECLRWGPPTPLGISHRAMEEGELDGKFIPKDSMIVPNLWYMTHDERNYADPNRFNPDRFARAGESEATILDPSAIVFGFGRRICPGRHFAEADLWLAIANILAVFDILPTKDQNGADIIPKVEFTPGLNSWPKEFKCRFIPRREKTAALAKSAHA
ncbi:hypothetical protein ACEPAF_156 [Sanghuangporus sanghuang]